MSARWKNEIESSSGRSSATPAEMFSAPASPSGRDATALRSRLYSWSASAELRLREDDRELVAAHPAGDVRRANDVAHALRRLGEDAVAREVADAVVDRLEVVEVEDHERQVPLVAVRARNLAREGLVEVAPVVEAGERVEVGELPRFAEATRILDRRTGAHRELLELAGLLFTEAVPVLAREDRDQAERRCLTR